MKKIYNFFNKIYKSFILFLNDRCLNSAPKPHAFVSLPVQSKVGFKFTNLKEKFTLRNILITFVCLIFAYGLKLFLIYLLAFDVGTCVHFLLLGFIASIVRPLFMGLSEIIFPTVYYMDIGDLLNPGSTPRPSGARLPPQPQPQPTGQSQVPAQQPVIQQPAGGNNNGGANPAANAPWGNPNQDAGSNVNGPLQISDPLNQAARGYNPQGGNQPLARNIASALEHQKSLVGNAMSRFVLSPLHQQFLLDHLSYNERDLYDKLMNPPGQSGQPVWWKVSNTARLRNSIHNAT